VIFVDDDDRQLYLRLLAGVVDRFRWMCLGYCLMPNHVHLVVETRSPNLGRGMHVLHGLYAQLFNERYSRVGHLFQGRFGSSLVHDDRQLAALISYVALNPVAAGLCKAPEDWAWGSHRFIVDGLVGPVLDFDRLRMYFAPSGDLGSAYEGIVSAGLRELV
jgi:REP element-mobilizing transposase RayT